LEKELSDVNKERLNESEFFNSSPEKQLELLKEDLKSKGFTDKEKEQNKENTEKEVNKNRIKKITRMSKDSW
jgi:hypothetical protein